MKLATSTGDFWKHSVSSEESIRLIRDAGFRYLDIGLGGRFFAEDDSWRDCVKEFMGYDHDTAKRFWNLALKKYLGTEDENVCRSVEEKAMIIGYTRLLRRAVRRPNEKDSAAMVAHCKETLAYLLNKVDTLTF
mgnify:CR=1 FL=1